MAYERKDYYYRRAKEERKASRAVYKLAELQERFALVKTGDVILDLGCAPGGWMQELSSFVGPNGRVIGIDQLSLKITPPKNCTFIQGNLEDPSSQERISQAADESADAIFSDMSPDISGISFADTYHSHELAKLAFETCKRLLKPGGNFVVKIFPGSEFKEFIAVLKKKFSRVETVVPKATRKTSSERYLVAIGFKPAPHSEGQ